MRCCFCGVDITRGTNLRVHMKRQHAFEVDLGRAIEQTRIRKRLGTTEDRRKRRAETRRNYKKRMKRRLERLATSRTFVIATAHKNVHVTGFNHTINYQRTLKQSASHPQSPPPATPYSHALTGTAPHSPHSPHPTSALSYHRTLKQSASHPRSPPPNPRSPHPPAEAPSVLSPLSPSRICTVLSEDSETISFPSPITNVLAHWWSTLVAKIDPTTSCRNSRQLVTSAGGN